MLSTTSKYALKALVSMARMQNGKARRCQDLALETKIPINYLYKILLALRNADILTAARGMTGGYKFSKSPEEIHLIEVVQIFEGKKKRAMCFLGDDHECSDHSPCSAHELWRKVQLVLRRFLESTTIVDISRKPMHNFSEQLRKKND